MGYACSSSVTMMNLMCQAWKHKKIWSAFNLEIVQKRSPGSLLENVRIPTQVLYGECATDLVLGFIGVGDFDLIEFLAL